MASSRPSGLTSRSLTQPPVMCRGGATAVSPAADSMCSQPVLVPATSVVELRRPDQSLDVGAILLGDHGASVHLARGEVDDDHLPTAG